MGNIKLTILMESTGDNSKVAVLRDLITRINESMDDEELIRTMAKFTTIEEVE